MRTPQQNLDKIKSYKKFGFTKIVQNDDPKFFVQNSRNAVPIIDFSTFEQISKFNKGKLPNLQNSETKWHNVKRNSIGQIYDLRENINKTDLKLNHIHHNVDQDK